MLSAALSVHLQAMELFHGPQETVLSLWKAWSGIQWAAASIYMDKTVKQTEVSQGNAG